MAYRSYNEIAKELTYWMGMNQSEKPKPPAASARKQTPRVPANILYDRIIPIVLVIAAVILLLVLAAVILGVGQPY